jgi:23S rRNA (uracil1939-C5)-methyltransferase
MASGHQVRIDALAFGGAGVGRLPSGKVVLVDRGAPGDLVTINIVTEKRSLVLVTVDEVLEPAPCRVVPACPSAGRCGGCGWMHIGIDDQRAWKHRLLERELDRAGLLTGDARLEPTVCGASFGSRIRARLHREGTVLGTLGRRSHDVVPFTGCPALAPDLADACGSLAELASDLPPDTAEVELSVDARGQKGLAVRLDTGTHADGWLGVATDLGCAAVLVEGPGGSVVHAPEALLEEDSAGVPVVTAPGLFVQSDRAMNARMIAVVMEFVEARPDATFVEVYAGVGNFTVHLARALHRGVACEVSRRAIPLLRRNVAIEGCDVEVRSEDDRRSARALARKLPVDLLLADPPRDGMKPLRPLFESAPPRSVVLVSCHPMAAVRDMKHLCATAGYRLERAVPIDMFPQTPHLELVAVLTR